MSNNISKEDILRQRVAQLTETIADLNKTHAQEVKDMYDHIFVLQGTIIELQNTIIENMGVPRITPIAQRELDDYIAGIPAEVKKHQQNRKRKKTTPITKNETNRLKKSLDEVYKDVEQEKSNDKFF